MGFINCLLLVLILGSILNYSLFLSTSLNSALTTSLVGVFKSVLQTAVGFFTFGGVAYHPINIAGNQNYHLIYPNQFNQFTHENAS